MMDSNQLLARLKEEIETTAKRVRAEVVEELDAANARIAELQEQVASWREAHESAAIIAAEECNRQKAELEARLKEAEAVISKGVDAMEHLLKRATTAEAEAGRLRKALEMVEAYLSSEESPLYHLWEDGDICAYDDNPIDHWQDVLLELRNFNIPADSLGYGTEWEAVTLYRAVLAAIRAERQDSQDE